MDPDRVIVDDINAILSTVNVYLVIATLVLSTAIYAFDWHCRATSWASDLKSSFARDVVRSFEAPAVVTMCTLFMGMWVRSCLQKIPANSHFWAVEIVLYYLFPVSVRVNMPRHGGYAHFPLLMIETCTCALFGTIFGPQSFSLVFPWLITAIYIPMFGMAIRDANISTYKYYGRHVVMFAALLGCLLLLCYCQHGTARVWEVPCKGAYHDELVRKDSLCSMISAARKDPAPVTVFEQPLGVVAQEALDALKGVLSDFIDTTTADSVVTTVKTMSVSAMLLWGAIYPSVAATVADTATTVVATTIEGTLFVIFYIFTN